MDRLTVKSEIIDGHYTLKCMCGFGRDGAPDDEDACYEYCELWGEKGCKQCEKCGIQQAFDRLAAYEDTGLSPKEIIARMAELEDTRGNLEIAVEDLEQEKSTLEIVQNAEQKLKKYRRSALSAARKWTERSR